MQGKAIGMRARTVENTGPDDSGARADAPDLVWFRAAVERYRDTVFRVAYSYLRSQADADDICQDVFVSLYRADRTFESDEHLKAWLIRVTINRCKSEFRKPWRRVEDIEDHAQSLEAPPEGKELLAAVMALPERYRVPIYLHYYEGYRTAEIAGMLDVPDATVRTRLARARRQLARALGEDGNDD